MRGGDGALLRSDAVYETGAFSSGDFEEISTAIDTTQINKWKKHLQTELPQIFSTRREKREQDHEALQAQLYQQIGQLKVELDWLKKKSGLGN
jgi:hypothetical protein